MLDVSIIFVNYKNTKLTIDAIKSVKGKSAGFSYEIIVVDNSNDGSFAALETELHSIDSSIKAIDANDNLGFGRANNLGSKYVQSKYLYFLNTDTFLINNAIFELFDFLEKNNNVGIVGSNLFTKDELPNHSFMKDEKNLKNEKKYGSFFCLLKHKLSRKRIDFNYTNNPLKINGYVCGASLMIRKEDFEILGGFDKGIFMYAEEALLCYRLIHELGKEIYNIPSSKIIHLEGGGVEKNSLAHMKMFIDGNTVYYKKLFGDKIVRQYLKYNCKHLKPKIFRHKLMRHQDRAEYLSISLEAYKKALVEFDKSRC